MTSPTANPNRSCLTCPSFIQAEENVGKFKKAVGAPMCGKFGYVLGKPGMKQQQGERIAKHFAKSCDEYGMPASPVPVDTRFFVAIPDMEARDESSLNPSLKELCSSCASCKNFVRDDVVADELGWTTGLCAAKGRLILPNRRVLEARDCEYRQFGEIRSNTAGLHLLPEYEDAFQLSTNPVKAYFKNKDSFVDPREWSTEREVTPDELAQGIRAWRRVLDPEGTGNEVFLPIYNHLPLDEGGIFTSEELSKVPQAGDDEHPELYVDHFGGTYAIAVLWTELDETPACWGEAGVGKTELYRYLAWLMQLPFERLSITASTELDDLAGKMHYSPDKGTHFQYGRLPIAWTKPSVICIDEPNTGPPDVWQFLRPLTDNSKQLVMDQNNGERLSRHVDCFLGMAMNPAWDPKNVGAQPIGDADVSRLVHIFVELPPAALEREIIKNRVALDGWEIDTNRLDAIMKIAEEIRGLSKDQTLSITWGIRPQLKVARASRWFDMVTAYRRAVGDFLEPEAQQILLDVVRANVST